MAQESDDARSRMNRLDMLSSTTNSDPSMALAMGGSIYQNDIITPAFLMKKRMLKNGGVAMIDGKELTGKNGYWYLDGEKVTDIEAMLEKVQVDEWYVKSLMNL